MSNGAISRNDLEQKFRQFQGEVTDVAEKTKGYALYGGVGLALVVLLLTFLLGSRRGKRKSTIVEIRRL